MGDGGEGGSGCEVGSEREGELGGNYGGVSGVVKGRGGL